MKKTEEKTSGTLFVIATPIGNLDDISNRAIDILGKVDTIYCEDTRVSKKLLSRLEINKELIRADTHTDEKVATSMVEKLREGVDCALITDAGTPGISDPGAKIVSVVRMEGYGVQAIPGPSAVTAALSISGFPANKFVFLGFPPHKKGRKKFFDELIRFQGLVVIIYESPHRLLKSVESLADRYPKCEMAICRELTKIHEQTITGTATEIWEKYKSGEIVRGEYVILINLYDSRELP